MRLVPVLLALSLAANVFIGGIVAGHMFGPHGFHHRGGPGRDVKFEERVLSPEGRETVRAAFKEKREDLFASAREAKKLRAAISGAMGADPFDRARAEAAVAALQAHDAEQHRLIASIMIDAAEKLSPEDRKALAAAQLAGERAMRGRMLRMMRDGRGPGGALGPGEPPGGPEGMEPDLPDAPPPDGRPQPGDDPPPPD